MERTHNIYASCEPWIRVHRVRHRLTGEHLRIEDSITPRLDVPGWLVQGLLELVNGHLNVALARRERRPLDPKIQRVEHGP